MRPQAVLFDLDGTLLNTMADLAAAGNHTRAVYGLPPLAEEAYKKLVGNGIEKLVERFMTPQNAALYGPAYEEFCAYYAQHLLDNTAPYAGIPALLAALAAQNIRMAVVTNKDDAPAKEIIRRYFGAQFAVVAGHVPGLATKPDAAIVHRVLAALQLSPQDAVYVGDSNVDIFTGHNAGMRAVGVTWGFRAEAELAAAGADALAHTPAELQALLLEQ